MLGRFAAPSAALAVVLGAACSPAQALEPTATRVVETFDAPLDEAWTVLNANDFEVEVREGQLVMTPHTNNVWWLEAEGPGVVREIEGNFRVSARVYARKASDPSAPVDSGYQFAGLIARDPASGQPLRKENYVFSVVGWRGDYLSAETKTTRQDRSDVLGPDWESGDADLRICRVDDQFVLYNRALPAGEGSGASAGAWQHAVTYERPDLPDALQVGPIAYTFTNEWDLEARFDGVVIEPVTTLEDCVSDE